MSTIHLSNYQINLLLGDITPDILKKKYYLDYSGYVAQMKTGVFGPFDKNFIPLVDYDLLFNAKNQYGIHYTPVTIAEYGLALFCEFNRTKDLEIKKHFFAQANWLMENMDTNKNNCAVWVHNFEFPLYNLSPGWVSAMAQGEGISVLVRAYLLSKNHEYLESARQAANVYYLSIKNGGVVTKDASENVWFEEFPALPHAHVLNGHIWALLGLCDLWVVIQDNKIYDLIIDGINTIKNNIHKYSKYYWSVYGLLFEKTSSLDYHKMHINQLNILYKLTNDKIFQYYASLWNYFLKGNYSIPRYWLLKYNNRILLPIRTKSISVQGISYYH